jgi:manganese/zinc/iron transport system substrate-binding protein
MPHLRFMAALLLACLVFRLGGCSRADSSPSPTTDDTQAITVVCTVGMVADIVKYVAGDVAHVNTLMGEGVNPHSYTPTRNDAAQLLSADAVFYSGLLLEGKMVDTLVQVGRKGKPVYAVTERIAPAYLLEAPGAPDHHDPHVWMDVQGWIQAATAVEQAMCELDEAHADSFHANAAAYRAQLETLDAYVRDSIASIPQAQRVLITAHDAFNYFGRAYDIEVLGIQGISTESEAGLDDINRLVDLIVTRRVQAVFVETSVSDKNVKALIEGAASRGHTVHIGGTLFSDAMGPADTYEGTYIGMLDHNATTITRALGGEAPAGGMQGRLANADATTSNAP